MTQMKIPNGKTFKVNMILMPSAALQKSDFYFPFYISTHINIYTYTHTHTQTHTNTYTHTNIHTRTCTHIHIAKLESDRRLIVGCREGIDEKYLCDADPLTLGIAVQPDSEKDCDIFWCQKYITNNLRSAQALWNRYSSYKHIIHTSHHITSHRKEREIIFKITVIGSLSLSLSLSLFFTYFLFYFSFLFLFSSFNSFLSFSLSFFLSFFLILFLLFDLFFLIYPNYIRL